uniref:Uncharacterized protein n=1 Tax=Setaria digitata TaxID=48799 RepID=A0A915PTU9_9BILA
MDKLDDLRIANTGSACATKRKSDTKGSSNPPNTRKRDRGPQSVRRVLARRLHRVGWCWSPPLPLVIKSCSYPGGELLTTALGVFRCETPASKAERLRINFG